jgi:ribulose-5-phosphate 4-epimerase/fuculose-1-phosphate aldolase
MSTMRSSRRSLMLGTVLASASLAIEKAFGEQQSAQPQGAGKPDKLLEDLVAANRILVDQGVLDGYGHVSVRSPNNPERFWMARSVAPELVTPGDLLEHDFDGNVKDAPPDVKLFLERFIHGGIYRARPDVKAVVHNHAPSLIPFGVTGTQLKPLYHMSAFLGPGVPVFEIRSAGGATDMLVKTPALGKALAQTLGSHPMVLMRGHGAAVVGPDLPHAVFRSVYSEVNARLQAQAMALGGKVTYLNAEEARLAETSMSGTLARPWELWRKKAMSK